MWRKETNLSQQKRNRQKSNEKIGIDSNFRLIRVNALTEAQQFVEEDYNDNCHIVLSGLAGTGKSFWALYLALKEVLSNESPLRKVYILRSAVSSRDLGFLPGKVNEKIAPLEAPYIDIVNRLFGRGDGYSIAVQKDLIQFVSTSYLRGTTINNAVVVVDEAQCMTEQELSTIVTRLGKNSRLMVLGDMHPCQNDLYRNRYDVSGFARFIQIMERIENCSIVEFGVEDIVRSGLCKSYILSMLEIEEEESKARSELRIAS